MTPKFALQRIFWTVLIILLVVACGTLTPDTNTNVAPTISVNSTVLSKALTEVAQTLVTIPTSTSNITETPLALTPTPLSFMALNGLRVAYSIDGNLYVQDSGKPAVQVTQSGQDSNPTFTDDGQKIAFYHALESKKKQIYSINSDGTGERVLVTSDLLLALGLGYDEITELDSLIIIPGTHQILFDTQEINSLKLSNTLSTPNADLLLVDMDTGAIKQILAIGQGGEFLVSPDGKLIAVQAPNEIEVIATQGQIVHSIPFTYPEHDIPATTVPMAWTQDSRELIVVPPIPVSELPHNQGFPVLRTVWRYSLDDGSGIEIRLNPPPVGEWFRISPDGHWIVYSYQLGYPASLDWDPGKPVGIYLGNLKDGTSKLVYTPPINEFDVPSVYHQWSPDSTHFVFEDNNYHLYIGSIEGEISPAHSGDFVMWIDNKRYLYHGDSLSEIDKEEYVRIMEYPTNFVLFKSGPMAFIYLER